MTSNATAITADHTELFALASFGAPELVSAEYADARAVEYVMAAGCCATCLVDGEDATLTEDELAALDACPTCGVRSAEWMLAAEIDARTTELAGLARLDEAVAQA